MRVPPIAILLALICMLLGVFCIGHHSAAAHVVGVGLAALVALEGGALMLDWGGSVGAARASAARPFRFSPLGSISGWELRMIGGFYVFIGLILGAGVLAH